MDVTLHTGVVAYAESYDTFENTILAVLALFFQQNQQFDFFWLVLLANRSHM
jgi:hypothetical protein